jgi:hypothetical protein
MSRMIDITGKKYGRLTVIKRVEKLGVAFNVLDNRLLYSGWTIEKAITTPARKRRMA